MWRVVDKRSGRVLLDNADRGEAVRFADDVTGRARGTTAYVLGRRRSVYVQGRAPHVSVIVQRLDPEAGEAA